MLSLYSRNILGDLPFDLKHVKYLGNLVQMTLVILSSCISSVHPVSVHLMTPDANCAFDFLSLFIYHKWWQSFQVKNSLPLVTKLRENTMWQCYFQAYSLCLFLDNFFYCSQLCRNQTTAVIQCLLCGSFAVYKGFSLNLGCITY